MKRSGIPKNIGFHIDFIVIWWLERHISMKTLYDAGPGVVQYLGVDEMYLAIVESLYTLQNYMRCQNDC